MKQVTAGIFESRDDAEKAVNSLHLQLHIPNDEISYIYRNTEGKTEEIDPRKITASTPAEGATRGAAIGGALGIAVGIATVAGVIPILGPILAAGPLVSALGITGAIGSAAAGGVTGAAAGGIIGALTSWGIGREHAQHYEDRVRAGNILVAAHAEDDLDVRKVLEDSGALDVHVYTLRV